MRYGGMIWCDASLLLIWNQCDVSCLSSYVPDCQPASQDDYLLNCRSVCQFVAVGSHGDVFLLQSAEEGVAVGAEEHVA